MPPVTLRPLLRSGFVRSGAQVWSAGASPKITLVAAETASAKSSTGRLTATSDSSGIVFGGTSVRITRSAPYASAVPTMPPATARSTLSVSNCRTSRQRLPPSAARTAISRCRPAALDSSRFDTLAHAISSSRPTAPKSTHRSSRMLLGNVSLKESSPTRHVFGNCVGAFRARSSMIGLRSVSACASVTPGFSRPSRCTFLMPSTTRPRSKVTGR